MFRLSFNNILFIMSVLLLTVTSAMAQETPVAQETPLGRGPIVITADTLMADRKTNSAQFEGSVVARSEDMTLKSDHMKVEYGEGGTTIAYIEAIGNVTLLRGEQVVTSERAEYVASERKIIFTGSPRAVESSNVVTGTKMVYLIDEDRFIVEGSRVLLENTGTGVMNNAGH